MQGHVAATTNGYWQNIIVNLAGPVCEVALGILFLLSALLLAWLFDINPADEWEWWLIRVLLLTFGASILSGLGNLLPISSMSPLKCNFSSDGDHLWTAWKGRKTRK